MISDKLILQFHEECKLFIEQFTQDFAGALVKFSSLTLYDLKQLYPEKETQINEELSLKFLNIW